MSFAVSLLYALPPISKVVRTVLETEDGRTTQRGLQPELSEVAAKVRGLLVAEGVEVVAKPAADAIVDPELRRLRIEIETLRGSGDICLYGVKARLSRQVDPEDGPGPALSDGMVVGQRTGEGFQVNLLGTLNDVIRAIVDPPRPLSGVPNTGKPKSDAVEFDFSQIKIKHQPPAPPYPAWAKRKRVQGTVVIEIVVGEDGCPLLGLVHSGPPELLLAALGYALEWKFEPAVLNGQAVKSMFRLTMPFKLR